MVRTKAPTMQVISNALVPVLKREAEKLIKQGMNEAGKRAYSASSSYFKSFKRSRKGPSRFYRVPKRGRRYNRMKRMINKCKDEGFGEYSWRDVFHTPLSAASPNVGWDQFLTSLTIVNTRMGELKTYNPQTNTFVTTNYDSLAKSVRPMVTVSMLYEIRNNSSTAAKVQYWICKPMQDGNINPYTAINDDLTDQVGNQSVTSETLRVPWDLQFSKKIWSFSKTVTKVLQPGESMTIKATSKPFCFDPALYDAHNSNYQKKYKIPGILVRFRGVLAHDVDPVYAGGRAALTLDAVKHTTIKVRYNSGLSVRYSNSTSNVSALSSASVTGNKPAAAVQTHFNS